MTIRTATLADGSTLEYVEVPDPPRGGMKRTYFTPDRRQVVQFFHDQNMDRDVNRRRRLEAVVGSYNPTRGTSRAADYWQSLFCWPTAVVIRPSLGIVCPAYPSEFFFDRHPVPGASKRIEKKGRWFFIPKLRRFLTTSDRGNLRSFLAIATKIARAVRRLHAAGLAHSDLSSNNVLVDPRTARAIVIDLDSLVVPGIFPPDVLGTRGYIAPEVIATSHLPLGSAGRKLPDIPTDQHALAVMIYEYLLHRHPLEGPKIHPGTVDDDDRLRYGSKALYIEHPADLANRPDKLSPRADDLGAGLAGLFRKAFVEGLHARERRPTASDWERELIKVFDLLYPCATAGCTWGWFVVHKSGVNRCPACGSVVHRSILTVEFQRNEAANVGGPSATVGTAQGRLTIFEGLPLRSWHVFADQRPGETADPTPLARFELQGGVWTLVNERLPALRAPDLQESAVPPGGRIPLRPGLRLQLSDAPHGRWLIVPGGTQRSSRPGAGTSTPNAAFSNGHSLPSPRPTRTPLMIDPLQALKSLFADRPEVVAMFDRRELDLQALTDARLVDRYRQRGLYPEPVNLYVTGRTGAGKSTLGNRFLTNSPLPSTGRMDCTDKVQFFRLASNLVYLDLPGSGASDAYENINRAALLVEQLSYKPTDVIPMIDFSDVHATGQDPKSIPLVSVPLARWRSDEFRQQFESDVILYVVAPHMQWLRPDRDYARDLLQARKEATGTANVIFALNLFRGVGGAPMSTPENIADVRQKIREVWQEVLEGEPTILDVNSRTGQGLHDLAEAMCRLVPAHKIGNMGQSLTQELRDAASAERARRFHGMLVSIAARLATFKVDATLGHDDLLRVALTAICSYALDVFYGEAIIQEAQQDLVRVARETTLSAAIDSTAATTRQNREQAIKISVQDVIEEAETVERITGYEPRIENVEEEEEVTVYKPETVTMEREALVQFGASLAEGLVHSVVAPLGAIQSLFGAKRTVHDDISDVFKGAYAYTEQRLKQETETVTRFRQKIVGFEEQKEMVTRMVPRVVVREQEVGRQALAGGAAVVEDVLAFGMAIEGLKPGSDLAAEFDRAVEKTRADVRAKLKPIADRIDSLATSHDVVAGERQLLSMLNPLFVA